MTNHAENNGLPEYFTAQGTMLAHQAEERNKNAEWERAHAKATPGFTDEQLALRQRMLEKFAKKNR